MRGCLWRVLQLSLLLLVLDLAFLTLTHPGRTALESAGIMVEVFPNAPAYPLRWFTPEPVVTTVRYSAGGYQTTADVYRPAGGGRHGALLFYIGVGPETRNKHVVRVAKGLARAGVVVMVPSSKYLSEFRVVPQEKDAVVAAYDYLDSQPYVDPSRVGVFGLSAGGSMVAVAAEDARIRDRVRLIDLFGSYYDAYDLVSALTLRKIDVDGRWEPWQPEKVSVDVFSNMLLSTVPEADRGKLEPLFYQRTTRIPPGLSPDGQAVARLLVNRDPAKVRALVGGLPAATRELLSGVSPSAHVDGLHAELFLMHDRDDDIIPFTESVRFYAEAEHARSRHLTILHLFRHVEPASGLNPLALAREATKLYHHVYEVLYRLS